MLSAMKVFAQSCYSSNCQTCLSNPVCYYFVSCEECTYSSNGQCDGQYPISNRNSCPPEPPAPTVTQLAISRSSVYGTLGLSAIAVIVITIMAYVPVEEICGNRASPTYNGYKCSSHLLYFASCFLWIGLSLSLATPALPWIASYSPSNQYSQPTAVFATAFYYELCNVDSGTLEITFCPNRFTFSELLSLSTSSSSSSGLTLSSTELNYYQNALLLGAFGYIVTIGLLFPCAVMTSIALYRYNRYIKYGIPAYTSGCSLASLPVAQMIGWPSFVIFAIVVGCGIQLASTVAKLVSTSADGFPNAQYLNMPGVLAAGIGLFMQLLGLILVSVAAKTARSVKGVGCNRGGCCKVAAADVDEEDLVESTTIQEKVIKLPLLRSS
jgi:hypothetical protein